MLDRRPNRQEGPRSVFINGRFLGQRITGVQRYAREVLACLDDLIFERNDQSVTWILALPPGVAAPSLRSIRARSVGVLQGHFWEQFDLPLHVGRSLLLGFAFTGPVLKSNQVITLHDAAVVRSPETYSWRFRVWSRLVISAVARRARRVLVVSEFGAAEALECFGVDMNRISQTTEGWQHLERIVPDHRILGRHGLEGKPFVLAVSSPTPNKNFQALSKAIALLGAAAPTCVVVGSTDSNVFQATATTDSLLRVGYVSDEELKALYMAAACFVLPSFYEGFGIPALEAMACGCPVLSSSAAALKETCGGAALYFDPARPDQLASLIDSLFRSHKLQLEMRETGLKRAEAFSWQEGAARNLAVISGLLEPRAVDA